MIGNTFKRDPSKLTDEAGRLAALRQYQILDTPEEENFDRLTRLTRAAMGAPTAAIALVDHDRRWFKSIAGGQRGEIERGVSFCSHTILQIEPLVVPNTLDDERFAKSPLVVSGPQLRAYLGVPLATPDGYQIGSMCCVDTKPRQFSDADIAVMRDFAEIVIDQMELRRQAHGDVLTGLLSRRGFMTEVERFLAIAQRHRRELSVLMLDIDHFKKINDTYGHAAGDAILRQLGERIGANLRRGDIAGRIGGEEFVIALPETPAMQAGRLAERIRSAVALAPFQACDQEIEVTVSIGVASSSDDRESCESLLARADVGLYSAKHRGRNRTEFCP